MTTLTANLKTLIEGVEAPNAQLWITAPSVKDVTGKTLHAGSLRKIPFGTTGKISKELLATDTADTDPETWNYYFQVVWESGSLPGFSSELPSSPEEVDLTELQPMDPTDPIYLPSTITTDRISDFDTTVTAKIAVETPLVIGNEVAKDFPTPVLVGSVGQWDAIIREQGNVVMDGDRYLMTYSGSPNPYTGNNVYVGLAESLDGIHWTKLGRLTGITRSSEDPYMLKVGNVWHLFVEDKEEVPFKAIRKYHSTDLATWVDDGQVLTPNAGAGNWEEQDVSSPVVWVDDAGWHLLYEGRNVTPGNGMTGYAHSTDGLTWTKSPSNPVIDAPGDFPWATQVVADDTFTYGNRRYAIGHAYNGTAFVFFMAVCLDDDYTQWTDAIGSRLRVRGYGSTDAMSSVQAIRTSADHLTIFYGLPNAIWRGMLSFPAEAFPTATVATVTDDATVTTLTSAWADLVTKTIALPSGWTSALLQISGQVQLQALATTTTLRTVQTNMTIDAVNPGAGPQVSFPPVVATFSDPVEHSKAKVITANATVVVRGRVTSTETDKTRTIGTTFTAVLTRLS